MTDAATIHPVSDRGHDLYPCVGELWDCDGRVAFVAGNHIDEKGRIWLFDWDSGEAREFPLSMMTLRDDRKVLVEADIVARFGGWARQGIAEAMWWLGWWYEGKNHPKSVWYYVASMRAAPKLHGWVQERLYADARSAVMRRNVPKPDLAFLEDIPEMQGEAICQDWKEAISRAEAAIHVPDKHARGDKGISKAHYSAPGDI